MKQWIFTVERRDDTRWHVCEAGLARSLASFGFKDDAIEYARELAGSWEPSKKRADDTEIGERATHEAKRIGVHA